MAQNWWEQDQVAPTTSGAISLSGPDPDLPVKRAQAQLELAAKLRDAKAAAVMDPLKVEQARMALEVARLKVDEAKKPGNNLTPQDRAKLVGQKEAIPLVAKRIDEIERLYDQNFSDQGVGALKEYLPGSVRPVNQTLDDAANSLLGPLGQAFGITAQQSNTPLELQLRFGPYLPQHGIRDEANRARIQRLREVVANQSGAVAQQLGEPPPQELATGAVFDNTATHRVDDPQARAQLSSLIRSGRPYEDAVAYAQANGFNPPDRSTYERASAFAQKHGGKTNVEAIRQQPTTLGQRLAASPVAAAVSGAANAATGGFSDELVGAANAAVGGDYATTRDQFNAAKQALAAQHPVADFTGNVLGAAGGAYGLTRIPGVLNALKAAPRVAPIASDLAYGAAYGAGENNENRLLGAGLGAGTALVAGPLGRKVFRAAGNLVGGPELQAPVQRLVDKGFVLSPAQRAAGNKTLLGNTRKKIDDALRSSPLVGDAITAQNVRQYKQLGRTTIDEALAPIGSKVPQSLEGNQLIAHANDEVGKAYDRALPGIHAPIDEEFIAANNAVRKSVESLPEQQRSLFDTIYQKAVTPFLPKDGNLTGKNLQDIKRGLDKQIIRLDKTDNPADEYLADELRGLRGAFFDWAGRAAPEKVAEFKAANAAYANMIRVNRAAAAAKKDGIFSPDQLLGAIKANSGDAQFASGGLPMQNLAQAAQQILPSTLPESGTFPRTLINTAGLSAAGGGMVAAPALTPMAALPLAKTAVHLPGIDKILQTLALNRSAGAARLGQELRRRQHLGSALTVPLAVEYASGNR